MRFNDFRCNWNAAVALNQLIGFDVIHPEIDEFRRFFLVLRIFRDQRSTCSASGYKPSFMFGPGIWRHRQRTVRHLLKADELVRPLPDAELPCLSPSDHPHAL